MRPGRVRLRKSQSAITAYHTRTGHTVEVYLVLAHQVTERLQAIRGIDRLHLHGLAQARGGGQGTKSSRDVCVCVCRREAASELRQHYPCSEWHVMVSQPLYMYFTSLPLEGTSHVICCTVPSQYGSTVPKVLAVCLSKLVRERPSPPAESSRVPGAHHSLSFLSLFTLGFTFRRPFTLTITSTSPTSIALPSVIHCAQDVLVPGVQVSRSLWEAKDSPRGPRY